MEKTKKFNSNGKAAKVLFAVFMAFALVFSVSFPAVDAFAVKKDDGSYNYIPEKKCDEDEEELAAESKSDDQAQPGDAGDWTQPGSEAYNNAKEIFDTLVDKYGFSGKAAAGVVGAIAFETGYSFDLLSGEMTNMSYHEEPARFKNLNDREPPRTQCYYIANGAGHTADYSHYHTKSEIVEETGYGNGTSNVKFCGGGGLFAFTPYQKYAYSEFWGKIKPDGWAAANQIAYAVDVAIWQRSAEAYWPGGAFTGSTCEDFLTCTDVAQAEQAWYVGYERGLDPVSAFRMNDAATADKVFNKENKPADKSKWQFHAAGSAPTISGSDDYEYSLDFDDEECKEVKKGKIDGGTFTQMAKQFAADKTIGYSQATRNHNPNMDCSSFIWYCLTECGVSSLAAGGTMGSSPFRTYTMYSILTASGFVAHPFTSYDSCSPGDILLRDGHTEMYLGKYDLGSLDSDGNPKESESGTHLTIGAHTDSDGQNGDGTQPSEGNWFKGEVSGSQGQTWEYYFTPDNVTGMDELLNDGTMTAAQQKVVKAASTTPPAGKDLCATWVTNVFSAAGVTAPGGDACDMYWRYCKSSDKSQLKPGMIIAIPHTPWGEAGWTYGHVGIYVGNGMVKHSVGTSVATDSVDSWCSSCSGGGNYSTYGIPRWGFVS